MKTGNVPKTPSLPTITVIRCNFLMHSIYFRIHERFCHLMISSNATNIHTHYLVGMTEKRTELQIRNVRSYSFEVTAKVANNYLVLIIICCVKLSLCISVYVWVLLRLRVWFHWRGCNDCIRTDKKNVTQQENKTIVY